MKRSIQWVFVAMAIFFASCSTGYKHLKTSKKTGFSVRNYQTFGLQYTFPEGADTLAPLFAESKQLATQTVAGYMAGKGLVKSETPELMVNLSVQLQEKTQTRTTDFRTDGLPRYMGQRRYSWKSEEIEVGKYQEGTLILDDKPVYHVECLDTYSLNLLKEMDRQMHSERGNNLLIHARCLELCYYILQRVEERKARTHRTAAIHPADVSKMNEIRHALLNDYQGPCPPVHVAAQRALMSPSKFKTLFRQMFGPSYYQFYKNVRMHKARELLLARQMNVSEVGYLLGYNNLSKFTRAFKNVFAVTPGSIAGRVGTANGGLSI